MPNPLHLSAILPYGRVLLGAGRRVAPAASWQIILLVAGLSLLPLAILGTYAIYTRRKEKQRTQSLAQIAQGLGFQFFPNGDADYFAGLNGLALFSLGRRKRLWNLLRGKSRSFEVGIFDYSYVTGGGRSSRTWLQTVLCLQSDAMQLPEFTLSPKGLWDMIGSLFGLHSIEFEGHPVFSKVYVVRGNDADAIRAVLTDDVLQFFEEHLGLSAQGSGERLLIYKAAKRVQADQIAAFLEDGLKLFSAMHPTG